MPSTTAKLPTPLRARATLASRTARFGPDHPDTVTARREFLAERLEAHIRQVVDGAPPLTSERRTALAQLLRPTDVTAPSTTTTH
ncbi:MAG: hypothetical protein ACRD0H_16870 [Actinomycetes bacterium]